MELSEANALVAQWHRHHQPSQGHRFSLGVADSDGTWHGAAIIGRPVARLAGSPRAVLEVVRLVTDGTYNTCSILYAAAARAGAAMGYERIQTYILDSETGASLRASGWTCEGAAVCLAAMLTPNLIPSVALAWLDGPATHARRPALPCGTHAAHNRHKNNGTPPCPACIAGERLYQRDRKRRDRATA